MGEQCKEMYFHFAVFEARYDLEQVATFDSHVALARIHFRYQWCFVKKVVNFFVSVGSLFILYEIRLKKLWQVKKRNC